MNPGFGRLSELKNETTDDDFLGNLPCYNFFDIKSEQNCRKRRATLRTKVIRDAAFPKTSEKM